MFAVRMQMIGHIWMRMISRNVAQSGQRIAWEIGCWIRKAVNALVRIKHVRRMRELSVAELGKSVLRIPAVRRMMMFLVKRTVVLIRTKGVITVIRNGPGAEALRGVSAVTEVRRTVGMMRYAAIMMRVMSMRMPKA